MGIGGRPQPPINSPHVSPGRGVYYPLLTPFIKVEWNDDSKQLVIKLYIAQLPPSPRHSVPFYKLDSKCCIDLLPGLSIPLPLFFGC